MPLKIASELLGINQYTAKTIMYTYKKEGRIRKKKNRTKRSQNSQTCCSKVLTRQYSINKIINSTQLKKVFPIQANTSNGSYGAVKFFFDVYKVNILNEYNLRVRMKNEETERQLNLMIPFPS